MIIEFDRKRRLQQMVLSEAKRQGYCRLTQLVLARSAVPTGSGSLQAQARRAVPHAYESATAPGAA